MRGAAHAVAVGSKALSLAGSCGASGRDLRLTGEQGRAWWAGCRRCGQEGSGRAPVNWAFPWPAPRQMQGQAAGRAGEPTGQGEEAPPQGLGGHHLLTETDARRPAARLCAIACTASHAALAAKRPDGRWLRPTPYLRSRMAFSISAWRRWSASSSRVSPSHVGDEQGQLRAGRGLHPPDDEPRRLRARGFSKRAGLRQRAAPGIPGCLAHTRSSRCS